MFFVYVDGRPKNANLIDYVITPNYQTQEVIFDVNFKDDLKGQRLRVDVLEN